MRRHFDKKDESFYTERRFYDKIKCGKDWKASVRTAFLSYAGYEKNRKEVQA